MVELYTLLENKIDEDTCQNLIKRIEESVPEPTDYHKIRLWDTELWKLVDESLETYSEFRALSLGLRWTCHRYTAGGSLQPHQDGSKYGSVYSVLVYLNDDFCGGQTDFLACPDAHTVTSSVKPVRGQIMVLEQDKWHTSTPVKKGVKYIARTDLRRPGPKVVSSSEELEIVV